MGIPRILLAALALTSAIPVGAQTWPSKPVTIVVGLPPGGSGDATARFLAEGLHERTGQRFLVETKPGANTMVGTQFVARAAPDGYTLLFTTVSAAMNVHLFKKVAYDHIKDFTPVTTIAMASFMLLVNPQVVPAASVTELTDYLRARPNKLAYGGAGAGGSVAAALYFSLSGLRREELTFVPYKGEMEALNDLVAGRIHFAFPTSASALQQARGGKLRALAITSAKRISAAPDIPTMAESGLSNYDLIGWFAVFLPANAPRDIAHKLAELCNASMGTEKGREFLKKLAMDPYPSSPEAFAQFLNDQTSKWGRLIKSAGIEPQ